MTEKELTQLIKSFGKKPGEFSKEEYFQIGEAHKKLDRKAEKSWRVLTEVVGWPGTSESYRSFIRRESSKLKNKAEVIPPETTTNSQKEPAKNYDEMLRNIYIEQQKLRDVRNDYNKQLRYEARLEDLRDTITSVAADMPPLPLISYTGDVEATEDRYAVLALSDWHIGQESDNFYNRFNPEVAVKRLKTIIAKAINYCHIEKVKVLHVLNLGDLIEGFINLDARIAQNKDVCEQVIFAAECMAEALMELKKAAPIVTYRSVIDNHARFHQDKKQSIPKENFNRLIDYMVKTRLKDSGIKFMEDNVAPNLGRFTLENGLKIAFAHGHESKDRKEHTLQTMVGAFREWTDVVIYGHTHNPAEHVYQNMRVFFNGSLCGVNEYAFGLGLFTEPSQKLLIFGKKDFLNFDLGAE